MLRHLKYGTTERDWFQRSLDEARSDPIGLWAMVRAGRAGFGLSDELLERFVLDFVLTLLQGGAIPVVGDRTQAFGWRPVYDYGPVPELAARAIVLEWKSSPGDPDEDGLWFAFPAVYE
jgi:hypothetical protein